MNTACRNASLLLVVAGLALTSSATAQTQRTGDNTARVMQQLQQANAEKTKLQTDNDALKKELEALKNKVIKSGANDAQLQQQKRELELSDSRQKQSADEAEQLRGKMQELIAKYRELAVQLQTIDAEREQAKSQVTVMGREQKACIDRNAGLYLLSDEIIQRLEDHGFWDTVWEKEPFTRVGRVRLENLADGYKDRANELRLSQGKTSK